MPEKTNKLSKAQAASAWLTPILLLLLSAGILLLAYTLMPTHSLQKYLNLAFTDDLKTTSTTAGLHIVTKEIDTENSGETQETGEVIVPQFGEQYALLDCPAADLRVGVYYGTNAELLDLGACQYSGSKLIGDGGNTVIDAHVNTYFSNLSRIKVGDEITVYTEYGKFTYQADKLITFDKSDKQYVAQTEDERLTLYTCKAQVLGNSNARVGVICKPVSKEFYKK